MAKETLLLVDDDPDLLAALLVRLRGEGYRVLRAGTGEQALATALHRRPDLVLLDVELPGIDGFETARRLRQTSQVPILFLTGRRAEIDQVLGLKLGGDDYLTKPFSPAVLSARVEALLRRRAVPSVDGPGSAGAMKAGEIAADLDRGEVRVRGRLVDLTVAETTVLEALLRAGGKILSREEILKRLWGGDGEGLDTRSVDQHITRLRRKLGPEAARVVTVRGRGYKMG